MSFVALPLKKSSYERDGLIEAAAKQLRPYGFGRAESAVIGTHQGPYFVQGQGVAGLKRYAHVQFEGENWDGTKTVLNGTVERAMAGPRGAIAFARQMGLMFGGMIAAVGGVAFMQAPNILSQGTAFSNTGLGIGLLLAGAAAIAEYAHQVVVADTRTPPSDVARAYIGSEVDNEREHQLFDTVRTTKGEMPRGISVITVRPAAAT